MASRQESGAVRVSVVMPTRNRAEQVAKAAASVLAQSEDRWELIIVDDASNDATDRVVAALMEEERRIRAIRLDRRVGAAVARNRGIAVARGAYVAFLDDDAEWHPEKLARQASILDREPEVGVVYSPFVFVAADGSEQVVGSAAADGDNARRVLLLRNFIDTSCVLVRRTALESVDGFDELLPRLQDWDLWVRLAAATRFRFLADPLVRCHFTPGSISTQSDALVSACRRLLAKVESDPGVRRGDLAGWHCALGHALMIGGAPAEGRSVLIRALRHQPWSPLALSLVVLSACGAAAYRSVDGGRHRIQRFLQRRFGRV